MVLKEENGYYEINCNEALWATDKHHELYLKSGSVLSDADWIIETKDEEIIIIEYKNGMISDKSQFKPNEDKKVKSVARKFYDTLHFLNMSLKNFPVKYIYVLEWKNSDAAMRKALRNKIKKLLPFKMQENFQKKLISEFDIISISEWNERYPQFPILRTEKI
ncbi:MAG: hypothetical protein IJS61_04725 [Firmicutes bacterium]|nr:hypothetical protein [Bacillota bacterium]